MTSARIVVADAGPLIGQLQAGGHDPGPNAVQAVLRAADEGETD